MRPQPTRRCAQTFTVTLAKRMLTILCAVLLVFSTPLQSLAQDNTATREVAAAISDSTEDAAESKEAADGANSDDDTDDTEDSSADSADGASDNTDSTSDDAEAENPSVNTDDTSNDTESADATQGASDDANTEDDTDTNTAATLASTPVLMAAPSGANWVGTWWWYLDSMTGTLSIGGTNITNPGSSYDSWPWYSSRDSITEVFIDSDATAGSNLSYMFYGCWRASSFYVINLDTSNVQNMSYMFYGCTSLEGPNFSSWNTERVTDMSYMFYGCTSMSSAGTYALADWDTSRVQYMSYMFAGCTTMVQPYISGWTTSSLINMEGMFSDSGITTVDFSGWDTSKVTNMSRLFYNCTDLQSLNISSFNTTTSTTNMGNMFTGCSSLRSITLGENFSFKGASISSTSNQALLPTPPETTSRTQCWIFVDADGKVTNSSQAYTAEYLRNNYSGATMAGTYVWDTSMTVRIYANGGSISGTSNNYVDQVIFYNRDQTVATTDYTFTRGGYTLLGWSWDEDATTAEYEAGKDIELSANDWKEYYFDTTGTYATYDSTKVIVSLYSVWSQDTYTLTIYKYTGEDDESEFPGTGLVGAVFSVAAVGSSDTTTHTTTSDGTVSISGLKQDTVYKITETQAPSGYTLADAIYIKVVWDDDENKLVGYVVDALGNYTYKDKNTFDPITLTDASDGSFIIKVYNEKLESLPQTGGSGTLYIFASGIALMALAVYVLTQQKLRAHRQSRHMRAA